MAISRSMPPASATTIPWVAVVVVVVGGVEGEDEVEDDVRELEGAREVGVRGEEDEALALGVAMPPTLATMYLLPLVAGSAGFLAHCTTKRGKASGNTQSGTSSSCGNACHIPLPPTPSPSPHPRSSYRSCSQQLRRD